MNKDQNPENCPVDNTVKKTVCGFKDYIFYDIQQ
jgi:hypothetical protein